MNGLMIAFAFSLPYHVLRTAAAAGVRVHVLGSGPSRGLRASRFCASYRPSRASGSGNEDREILIEEIAQVVRQRGIDVVFPSDDVSTRLLAAIRHRLPVRTTPLPDLATFDLLNDKWNFTRFSHDNGVRVPRAWAYDSAGEIRRDLLAGSLPYPVTVKPTNRSGGIGVIHVRDESEIGQLEPIDYRPILVQQHIVGETIGISVMCRAGKILAHATQRRDDRHFELFANPDLVDNVEKLAAATRLNGPANFDAVLEQRTGLSYIVECNPRFWFTIYLPMILGLNFLEFALHDRMPGRTEAATLAGVDIRLSPKAILRRPWRASRREWQLLAYQYADPLAFLLRRTNIIDDSEVAVSVEQMTTYEPDREPAQAARAAPLFAPERPTAPPLGIPLGERVFAPAMAGQEPRAL